MTYYIARTLPVGFDEGVARAEAALKKEGFGIISRVDIQATLKEKIGVAFQPYVILGACNPKLAHEALQLEDKVGTMLPCNVVVQEVGEGSTERSSGHGGTGAPSLRRSALPCISNRRTKGSCATVTMDLANLFSGLPAPGRDEAFATILERPGLRIERIVSHGHATPADAPLAQAEDEWVILVKGAARLWLDGGGECDVAPGDHLLIEAGRRHRVVWTSPGEPTIWLAVHIAR